MIETKNLTFKFGEKTAVDQLNLRVEAGEVLGFLGPNGAGKSTTMKMLTGFLTPTSGKAYICGLDIESQRVQAQKQIGYLPEGAPSYSEMSVYEFLNFVADIRFLTGAHKKTQVDKMISQINLETVVNQKIETLSKGYKRRVGLAQALIHDPKVLVLDEPTDGLDPNQKHQVRELITNLSKDKIVIVSTHILEEVTAVCTRSMIISEGKMLFDDTPAKLIARSKEHNCIHINFEKKLTNINALEKNEHIKEINVSHNGKEISIYPNRKKSIYPEVIDWLRQNPDLKVTELFVNQGKLDEVFRDITTPKTKN